MAKQKPDKEKVKKLGAIAKDVKQANKAVADMQKMSAELEAKLKKAQQGQIEIMEVEQQLQQQRQAMDAMSAMMKKQHTAAMRAIESMR